MKGLFHNPVPMKSYKVSELPEVGHLGVKPESAYMPALDKIASVVAFKRMEAKKGQLIDHNFLVTIELLYAAAMEMSERIDLLERLLKEKQNKK